MPNRPHRIVIPLLCVFLLVAPTAHALTLGEALAAEQLVKDVDAMSTGDRNAFIQQRRAQLNQALMVHQIIGIIGHTVEVTSLTAEKLYRHALLCGTKDGQSKETDDDDDDRGKAKAAKPIAALDLSAMAAAFKADLRKSLDLPDTPVTDARLNEIDVTDVIANRMIDEKRCPQG